MIKKIFIVIFAVSVCFCFMHCKGKTYGNVTTIKYDSIDEDDSEENKDLVKLIKPYDDALNSEMEQVIGTSDLSMSKARPEGLLSNFVADLVFNETAKLDGFKADFCLLNHGGLRAPLPKGDIKVKNIYELMPFENEVVIVEIEGHKVKEIASYLNYTGGEPVSGIKLNLSTNPEILIQNKAVDVNRTYKIITSDYLAKGGDKMYFFSEPISLVKTGIKLRDMIMNHVKELTKSGKTLKANLDGRIS